MISKLFHVLRIIRHHELASRDVGDALRRFVALQVAARIIGQKILCPYAGEARLFCRAGMTGANANYYLGLMEFRDMAFLLHYLRPADLFVDCGANVGSYSILASKVVGARTIAFEPVPETIQHFLDNVAINHVEDLVSLRPVCVGDRDGMVKFTRSNDTTNRIFEGSGHDGELTMDVRMTTLDAELADVPRLVKIDTEGFDGEVLIGAAKTLDRDQPMSLIVELGARSGGRSDGEMSKYLESKGFSLVGYDPFRRALSTISQDERRSNNHIFVRDVADAAKRVADAPRVRVGRYASI